MNTAALHRKKDSHPFQQHLPEFAANMVGRDGVAGLSVIAVAREAGVRIRGLLHHFPYKIVARVERLLAIGIEAILRVIHAGSMADGHLFCTGRPAPAARDENRLLRGRSPNTPNGSVRRSRWRDAHLGYRQKGETLVNGPPGTWVATRCKAYGLQRPKT